MLRESESFFFLSFFLSFPSPYHLDNYPLQLIFRIKNFNGLTNPQFAFAISFCTALELHSNIPEAWQIRQIRNITTGPPGCKATEKWVKCSPPPGAAFVPHAGPPPPPVPLEPRGTPVEVKVLCRLTGKSHVVCSLGVEVKVLWRLSHFCRTSGLSLIHEYRCRSTPFSHLPGLIILERFL